MTYSSDVAITVNGFAAAVFGGLGSIRLALIGGYALGILEQLVVGYIDPQYSLIIALIVMLVLIGWRSRAEIASASHEAHAAIQRARVPWPAPVRIALILAERRVRLLASVPALVVRRLALRPHGPICARHDRPHAADGIRGSDLARPGRVLPHRRLHVGAPHRWARPGDTLHRPRGGNLAPRSPSSLRPSSPPWSLPSSASRCFASTATTSPSQRSRSPSSPSPSPPPGTASPAASTASRSRSRSASSGMTCEGRCTQLSSGVLVTVALLLATNLVHSRVG